MFNAFSFSGLAVIALDSSACLAVALVEPFAVELFDAELLLALERGMGFLRRNGVRKGAVNVLGQG